jgi:hypothetical protein
LRSVSGPPHTQREIASISRPPRRKKLQSGSKSSSGDSCSILCRVALCGSASTASSRTVAAVNYCRFADIFFKSRYRKIQQHRTLPPPVLPARGSVRIAAEPWSSSKSSLRNRWFGDWPDGRASLTLHSNLSSSSHSLAPARKPEVCPETFAGARPDQNRAREANARPIFQPRRRNLWVTAGVSDPFQLGTVGVFCRRNRRISADLHRRDRSAAHRIRSS